MLHPILSGQDDLVIGSQDFEINPGVAADNLNVLLSFNLVDAVTTMWKEELC